MLKIIRHFCTTISGLTGNGMDYIISNGRLFLGFKKASSFSFVLKMLKVKKNYCKGIKCSYFKPL